MDCCDGLKWDDISKIQDIASALHPFTNLVCKQVKVNEGRACKNLKWEMFAFSFFISLNAFLDTCASKVTDSSEGKLSQNHSILERKWLTRSVALGRRGVWGKTQEREAGVRFDPPPQQKWFQEWKWHLFQREVWGELGRRKGRGREGGEEEGLRPVRVGWRAVLGSCLLWAWTLGSLVWDAVDKEDLPSSPPLKKMGEESLKQSDWRQGIHLLSAWMKNSD